ncbi:MAG: type IV toxin-antitoxin system AbiEi family antitoxin domain-containing protein [Chitinophagaceae bacterium]|nr:type IV toxin-antitoxin system AbiEi family antitoxin domain-containing protein [Chitinophagaceae bacterium]MCW5928285.1 type IV toxin-antitoxin system AbiEi family antitoxin domain-containing protein [Chitinophagaceae bacterium]
MSKSIEIQVLEKVKRSPRGTLFFVDSFAKIANAKSVNKALERLVKSGEIERVAQGIYVHPVIDDYIGKVLPGIEEIAVAIAKRDRATVVPTGSYAMYKLGLTTQVPLNIVFYSDTSARKINIGKQSITFKKASSKNLAFVGEISTLAIQALRTIGKDLATAEEIKQIKKILKNENPKHLQHDLQLAPVWIRKLIATNG